MGLQFLRQQLPTAGALEGGRRRGRQKKCWMDNIKEWTFIPVHARTAHNGLQKRLEEDLC